MNNRTSIFLPLKTNIDLFNDEQQVSPETKAKHAAILYDEIIVELGFMDVSIAEKTSTEFWIHPDEVTEEHNKRTKTKYDEGTTFSLSIGEEKEYGVPSDNMRTVVTDKLLVSHSSEWQNTVLNPLINLGADFIKEITVGKEISDNNKELRDRLNELNKHDKNDIALMKTENKILKKFIYESFNNDIVIADALKADIQVSNLFEPMLKRNGAMATGMTAIEIDLPDLDSATWEDIIEIRNHPGAEEAREKYRELEKKILDDGFYDSLSFVKAIAKEISNDLYNAEKEQQIDLTKEIRNELIDCTFGITPITSALNSARKIDKKVKQKLEDDNSSFAAITKIRK